MNYSVGHKNVEINKHLKWHEYLLVILDASSKTLQVGRLMQCCRAETVSVSAPAPAFKNFLAPAPT
jgi:hypothetical protein